MSNRPEQYIIEGYKMFIWDDDHRSNDQCTFISCGDGRRYWGKNGYSHRRYDSPAIINGSAHIFEWFRLNSSHRKAPIDFWSSSCGNKIKYRGKTIIKF